MGQRHRLRQSVNRRGQDSQAQFNALLLENQGEPAGEVVSLPHVGINDPAQRVN